MTESTGSKDAVLSSGLTPGDLVDRVVAQLRDKVDAPHLLALPDRLIPEIAERTVNAIVCALRGDPVPSEVPPALAAMPADVVGELCSAAAATTWQALIETADVTGRRRLQAVADQIFLVPQRIVESAAALRGSVPASTMDLTLRSAVARALVRAENAEKLADCAGIRLAPGYVVAAMDRGEAHPERSLHQWPSLERDHDVLVVVDDDVIVLLLPADTADAAQAGTITAERLLGDARSRTMPAVATAPAPTRGLVPSAVDEVRLVLHVVRTLNYPGGIYQLDEVPVEVALLRSPDVAEVLASRLEPLVEVEAPLLETLQAYLYHEFDRKRTAASLHVHLNTLDYRLRRVWQLTGLSPRSPRGLQLLVAALAARGLRRA